MFVAYETCRSTGERSERLPAGRKHDLFTRHRKDRAWSTSHGSEIGVQFLLNIGWCFLPTRPELLKQKARNPYSSPDSLEDDRHRRSPAPRGRNAPLSTTSAIYPVKDVRVSSLSFVRTGTSTSSGCDPVFNPFRRHFGVLVWSSFRRKRTGEEFTGASVVQRIGMPYHPYDQKASGVGFSRQLV